MPINDAHREALDAVTAWLRSQGRTIETSDDPLSAGYNVYADGQRYDVVRLTKLNFTGTADYPYKTVWVTTPRRYAVIGQYVDWYVIVSADNTHALLFDAKTLPEWELKSLPNYKGVREDAYLCPLSLAKAIDLRPVAGVENRVSR